MYTVIVSAQRDSRAAGTAIYGTYITAAEAESVAVAIRSGEIVIGGHVRDVIVRPAHKITQADIGRPM